MTVIFYLWLGWGICYQYEPAKEVYTKVGIDSCKVDGVVVDIKQSKGNNDIHN